MSKETKIFAMGGIEEVGKNMYVVEDENEILVIDAGIKFANELLLGMNGIIPKFKYLKETKKDIILVITHGHEDHIGGVPYLLTEVEIKKIISPMLAMEMIKRKLGEFKLQVPDHEVYNENSSLATRDFKLNFFRVSHSVPDSFGLLIETKNGNIVTAGDFRFDFCSDEQTDINRISQLCNSNDVDLLLCESTNSETDGFSNSEVTIIENLLNLIKNLKGRIFISTFSSSLSRIEKVIEGAVELNRKICILGRSMENNIKIAKKIGYLHTKETDFISVKDIDSYNDNELLFILTGSQGEERAALNQIALGQHQRIFVKNTDTFIFSSNPIPGNFAAVEELVNRLYKTGANVIQHKIDAMIHASGHATSQEQQLMIKLVNPRYIIPIHGEYKMLKRLQNNASEAEFHRENVIVLKNGEVATLKDHEVLKSEEVVDVEPVLIDGKRISNNSVKIIEERKELSSDGVFNIIICLDKDNSKMLNNPQVSTRGIFFVKDTISLIQKISYSIKEEVEKLINSNKKSLEEIKKCCEETAKFYIWKNKKKNPKIITTIFNI